MATNNLNILSLNIGMSNTLAGLTSIVVSESVDLIFLQEVRLTSAEIESLLPGFSCAVNIDLENSSRPGTAIIWRSSIPVENVVNVTLCRIQVVSLGSYFLMNIYGPSGSDRKREREVFYGHDVFNALQLGSKHLLIVGGDFNCLVSKLDVEGGIGYSQKKCSALHDLIRVANLCDAFRTLYPDREEYTFFRQGLASSRLDRMYLSSGMRGGICGASHVASLSDHCGVKVVVNLDFTYNSKKERNMKSYWKLNSAILNDENFLPSFKPFWSNLEKLSPSYPDIAEWWDCCAKPCIKDFCVAFSVQRKHRRKQTLQFLLSSLKIALFDKDWENVARLKENIALMIKEDSMGFIIRSRYKQNAEEEQASIFHASKELKNSKNNMLSLKIGDTVTTDTAVIEEEVVEYFGALFNGHHDKDFNDTGSPFVPNNNNLDIFLQGLSKMSSASTEMLDEDISIEDLDFIVKECDYNKAPGFDGLTYEFYKKTWDIIRITFVMILQCQLDRKRLVGSNLVGATRLLPKVTGIPRVDELRPITLLNCDYRILTKLFVLRIKSILPEVIKSSQLCTVQNKNILFGVQNLLSSIFFIKQKRRGACLLSLDFYKAYDRVLVSFLLKVMEKMGFSPLFCSWIHMLHHNAQTKFLLGRISRAIDISFSIRQGDPLAMLLYILYIEPLIIFIERRVSGIGFPNFHQSVEAFCDDLNLVTEDISDLLIVDNAVVEFEKVSGALLSRNQKCKVLGIGTWKNRTNWPLDYLVTVKEIKVFGVFIMDSYRSILKRNWDYRFLKFEQSLHSWSSRSLRSILQRIEVVKIFALLRVYYIASVLPMSKTVGKKFEKVIRNFIWFSCGKLLRVSFNDLKLPLARGGLGLVCIFGMSRSLQLTQLFRLLKSDDVKSVGHVGYWIGDCLDDFVSGIAALEHARTVPTYFESLAELVCDECIQEDNLHLSWKASSNRVIYRRYIKNLPPCKIELDLGISLQNVWNRLSSPSLDSVTRERMYFLIHNKLPVRERLFRFHSVNDPYCLACFDLTGAEIHNRQHFFCTCSKVKHVWQEVIKLLVETSSNQLSGYSDIDLLTLQVPRNDYETELVWIISTYVFEIWSIMYENEETNIDVDRMFGFLKFKYKMYQCGARPRMIIPAFYPP